MESMNKWFLFLLQTGLSLTLTLGSKAQGYDIMKDKQALVQQSKNWIEGYNRSIKGTWIDYHSLRQEITRALLVRTTDGTMAAEWESAPIPTHQNSDKLGVLWLAGLDLNHGTRHFKLWINGESVFSFTGGGPSSWIIKGKEGATLSFMSLVSDQHGDGFGYMWMILPKKMGIPGKPLRIKISGAAENSSAWYMTFKAPDALKWLQQEARHEYWMNIRFEQGSDSTRVKVSAPLNWANKNLQLKIQGKSLGSCLVKPVLQKTVGTFFISSPALYENRKIDLFLDGKPVLHLSGYGFSQTRSQLGEETIVMNTGTWEGPGKWMIQSRTFYRPELFSRLKGLSDSEISLGEILLMNSSHQDIAWMDSPEKCIIERDTMLLTPLIKHAIEDSGYRFDIEDVLMLREYLSRHPETHSLVEKLLQEGRISVGASYNMPYEDMYSGESLLRQFYLGKRWLEHQFPGYQAQTYWNVDVPGRTPQMPQIMNGSGVHNMIISRQKLGVYRWYAPDNSYVTTFSPGHYSLAYPALNKDFFDAASFLANYAKNWALLRDTMNHTVIPLLSDWDMSPARDYRLLMKKWGSLRSYTSGDGVVHPLRLPSFKQVLADDFFGSLDTGSDLPYLNGERPNVWLYIHGPSHQKALKVSREADILLPAAEKFATIEALLKGSFENYPVENFVQAWEAKIFPDHGWGGKHGDITDRLFLAKFEQSKSQAREILNTALLNIAGHIAAKSSKGRPIVVFNDLSWKRTDPVSVKMRFEKGKAKSIILKDAVNHTIPVQLNHSVFYLDGSLQEAELNFIAPAVPSIGYKTFYVNYVKENAPPVNSVSEVSNLIETPFYRISLGRGGIKQIFDKKYRVNLFDTSHYAAGEVILMKSVGNGAGEFSDIQQPDPDFIDRTGNHMVRWKIDEDGPVYITYSYRQNIKHAVVLQKLKIYKQLKRIDFETSILNWDGTLYREFRETFPLAQNHAEVAYEVPYGRVRVGKDEIQEAAGERYSTYCPEIHPRSILNWMSSSDDRISVTISSSVVAWDYKDPKLSDGKQPVLQPILLASRKSCHGEGNEYLQTGDHHFRFSFTSHEPGWEKGSQFGIQSNHPLRVVVDPPGLKKGKLPETLSFFTVTGHRMNITTIKRQEEGDGFVVRWVEPDGKPGSSTLHSFFPLKEVDQTNLLELSPVPIPFKKKEINVKSRSFEIKTLQLKINFE